MHKRMTIRIVEELAKTLQILAKKRGLSVNALISEMAWDFVEEWNAKQQNK